VRPPKNSSTACQPGTPALPRLLGGLRHRRAGDERPGAQDRGQPRASAQPRQALRLRPGWLAVALQPRSSRQPHADGQGRAAAITARVPWNAAIATLGQRVQAAGQALAVLAGPNIGGHLYDLLGRFTKPSARRHPLCSICARPGTAIRCWVLSATSCSGGLPCRPTMSAGRCDLLLCRFSRHLALSRALRDRIRQLSHPGQGNARLPGPVRAAHVDHRRQGRPVGRHPARQRGPGGPGAGPHHRRPEAGPGRLGGARGCAGRQCRRQRRQHGDRHPARNAVAPGRIFATATAPTRYPATPAAGRTSWLPSRPST